MIKLIASDLDGTLLDSNRNLPKDFANVIKKLKEHNVLFTAISGRPYHTLEKDFGEFINDITFITDNGAQIIQKNNIIYKNLIETPELLKLLEEYKKYNHLYIILCGTKAAYVDSNDENFIKEASKYFYKIEHTEDLYDVVLKEDILKVTFCDFKNAEITATFLNSIFFDKLQISLSGEIWIDIMDKDVNKGTALQRVQDKHGISIGETAVFGDYYNDIAMFSKAYYSYCMNTSPAEVKSKAKAVLDKNPIEIINDIIERQFHP